MYIHSLVGYYFAHSLARRGVNLILISRTESKLKKVADEITRLNPVLVHTHAADLSTIDCYDDIRESLRNVDVGILINNVGMTQEKLSKFADTDNL